MSPEAASEGGNTGGPIAVEDHYLQYDSPSMKRRRLVAAAWITGATVPLLLATLFLVGCCILPFHAVMHKLMPICEMAASVMRGGDAHGDHEHDTTPPPPSREKQEPVKRIATDVPYAFRLAAVNAQERSIAPTATTAYRSFISLGAIRCDRDVGLHVLVETFLI